MYSPRQGQSTATEEKRAQWDLWRLQQQTLQWKSLFEVLRSEGNLVGRFMPPKPIKIRAVCFRRVSEKEGPADPSDYLSAGWEKICFSLRALGDWLRPPCRCTERLIGRRAWDNCGARFVWGAGSPPRRGLVSQSGHGGDADFHQSRAVRGHLFYSAPRMLMLRREQKAGKRSWK